MSASSPIQVAVLLSGGLDSSVALRWAQREHRVRLALSFNYGSNHGSHELACAGFQAESAGVPHRVIDISSIAQHLDSALLNGAAAIPAEPYNEENMRQTVVPFRNGIFLAIAAGITESAGCGGIVIAAHSGDHAVYPDCRESFMQAMEAAVAAGTHARLHLLRPFIDRDKAAIIRLGVRLGVDFAHTYSCYKGRERHCGVCATCRERKQAFRQAGTADPTSYEA